MAGNVFIENEMNKWRWESGNSVENYNIKKLKACDSHGNWISFTKTMRSKFCLTFKTLFILNLNEESFLIAWNGKAEKEKSSITEKIEAKWKYFFELFLLCIASNWFVIKCDCWLIVNYSISLSPQTVEFRSEFRLYS